VNTLQQLRVRTADNASFIMAFTDINALRAFREVLYFFAVAAQVGSALANP
jgi:hypothetical protein